MNELTQKHLLELMTYEPETGRFVWKELNRKNRQSGREAGTTNSDGYRVISIAGKGYKAHRLAWLAHYGAFPEKEIDHINRDKSDNRVCNLRLADHAQNLQNLAAPRSDNKSGFLGVSFAKSANKWRATIKVKGKQTNIGLFESPEKASDAYIAAKRQVHAFCTI